jgi:hypothetical protein
MASKRFLLGMAIPLGALGVLVVLIIVGFIALVGLELVGSLSPYSGARKLKYKHFSFSEDGGTVNGLEFSASRLDYQVPALYLRFPSRSEKTYYLPSFSESDGKGLATSLESSQSVDGSPVIRYYSSKSVIRFKNGKLDGLAVTDNGIQFSASRDGPFLEVPTKTSNIIKVFGKPLEIQRQLRKAY